MRAIVTGPHLYFQNHLYLFLHCHYVDPLLDDETINPTERTYYIAERLLALGIGPSNSWKLVELADMARLEFVLAALQTLS